MRKIFIEIGIKNATMLFILNIVETATHFSHSLLNQLMIKYIDFWLFTFYLQFIRVVITSSSLSRKIKPD